MAQYTNTTPNFNDWNFYFRPFPYSEGLVVLLILLCGLKIQLQKPNRQRNVAVKWAVLPLEILMDEQFLTIFHAIEGITDATPLKEAAKQLPEKIYEIIKSQEQLTRIPAELPDQLVFDVSKTYYYSIIESLCRLIKTIQ